MLVVHLVLTGLPGVAAALLAARRGVRSVPILLAVALAASGAVAMLAYWAYYEDRMLGESLSYFALLGSIAGTGWALYGGHLDRGLLRQLATPLALWMLGSTFLVFFGYIHGGTSEPLNTAGARFIALPADNAIPFFFGEFFFHHGHHLPPPIFPGEWLASDRPPLQVGYMLSQRPFFWGNPELQYEVLGVVLQQLWIVGLWALLVAARVGRVTRALALLTVLVSDVAIVNGFFVWPKMLPAALLIAVAALVVTPLWLELRRSLWAAALVAALLGLAMMGHGSSVFGAIPLALIAIYRGLPSWHWVAVAALVGFVVMAPWSAYQKYGDPPGNRLVKWQLAGVPEIDSRGFGETLVDSYREAGFGGTLHNKGQNFITMAGGGPFADHVKATVDAVGEDDIRAAVENIRNIYFFDLLPSLGLLLVVPLVMAAAWRRGRRRREEWDFALICFAVLVIGAIAWGLLIFGNLPSRTVIHAGSFLLPVLAFCGAVAGLRATFPRFAIYFVGVSAVLMLGLYLPTFEPLPGSSFSFLAAVLAAAGLAGFGVVALRSDEPATATAPLAVPAES